MVKTENTRTIIHWGITAGFSVFLAFLLANYFAYVFGFIVGYLTGGMAFISNNLSFFVVITYLLSFVIIFFILDYLFFNIKISSISPKPRGYVFDIAIFLGVFSILRLITGPQGLGESFIIGAIVGGFIGPLISKAKTFDTNKSVPKK